MHFHGFTHYLPSTTHIYETDEGCFKAQSEVAKLKRNSTQAWDGVKKEMNEALASVKHVLGMKEAEVTRLKEEKDNEVGVLKKLLSERDDEITALNTALGMAAQQEKLAENSCRSKSGEIEVRNFLACVGIFVSATQPGCF